ncbi:MAG: heme oxygenase [Flavobacteriaceae bacterium]|nr:heme oxygenase [Flavobacteriaceae bacterium]|tara:strand:- start:1916 stop:2680 length:765 start_codon:yes stop_codon:yes gene_type:complete
MTSIEKLENNLLETRSKLISHPIYKGLNSKEKLICFMENHVFAVWDFMSLIKALQRNLTCVDVPWTPNSNSFSGKLVNEIVLAEESDVDLNNDPKSHFELYLDSMKLMGANTSLIDHFIEELNQSKSYYEAIEKVDLPIVVKEFMDYTFEVINTNKNHIIASVFTFGREDLIPDMFIEIVKKLSNEKNIKSDLFIYYLERHIELDADEHGPMALKMIQNLCGKDQQKWNEATIASEKALRMRIKLWDFILNKIS